MGLLEFAHMTCLGVAKDKLLLNTDFLTIHCASFLCRSHEVHGHIPLWPCFFRNSIQKDPSMFMSSGHPFQNQFNKRISFSDHEGKDHEEIQQTKLNLLNIWTEERIEDVERWRLRSQMQYWNILDNIGKTCGKDESQHGRLSSFSLCVPPTPK